MGYKENARECQLYGLAPEQVQIRGVVDRRFPKAVSSVSPLRPEVQFKNYN